MGVTQAHEKYAMKIKKEKMTAAYKFFDDRKCFVWLLLKLDMTNVILIEDSYL